MFKICFQNCIGLKVFYFIVFLVLFSLFFLNYILRKIAKTWHLLRAVFLVIYLFWLMFEELWYITEQQVRKDFLLGWKYLDNIFSLWHCQLYMVLNRQFMFTLQQMLWAFSSSVYFTNAWEYRCIFFTLCEKLRCGSLVKRPPQKSRKNVL